MIKRIKRGGVAEGGKIHRLDEINTTKISLFGYRAGAFGCVRVGRQWGKNYEIDVTGVNSSNELIVAGECKWSRHRVGMSVLNNLKQ